MFAGDFVVNDLMKNMMNVSSKLDPYAAFLGGNIGFDDGFKECFCILD